MLTPKLLYIYIYIDMHREIERYIERERERQNQKKRESGDKRRKMESWKECSNADISCTWRHSDCQHSQSSLANLHVAQHKLMSLKWLVSALPPIAQIRKNVGSMHVFERSDQTLNEIRTLWESAKVSHKRVFALLTPEVCN